MKFCNICGSDDFCQPVRGEWLCIECVGSIDETLGELNEAEDEVNMDDEFWAQVLADEFGDSGI